MTTQEAADLQAQIMAECRKIQRENPTWSFSMAFSECQLEHPDWFTDPETVRDGQDIAHERSLAEKRQVQDQRVQQRMQAVGGTEADTPTIRLAKKIWAAQTQQSITDLCDKLMTSNPGMKFSTAYALVQNQHPELFQDEMGRDGTEHEEKASEVSRKQAAIEAEIEKMRATDPHLTYMSAFNRLKQSKPALFAFDGLDTEEKADG